jgi:hypothetical protein
METILISAGIACIIAAIIGGGLKAFNIEFPLLASLKRQILLASFGIALMVTGFMTEKKGDVEKYQEHQPSKDSIEKHNVVRNQYYGDTCTVYREQQEEKEIPFQNQPIQLLSFSCEGDLILHIDGVLNAKGCRNNPGDNGTGTHWDKRIVFYINGDSLVHAPILEYSSLTTVRRDFRFIGKGFTTVSIRIAKSNWHDPKQADENNSALSIQKGFTMWVQRVPESPVGQKVKPLIPPDPCSKVNDLATYRESVDSPKFVIIIWREQDKSPINGNSRADVFTTIFTTIRAT